MKSSWDAPVHNMSEELNLNPTADNETQNFWCHWFWDQSTAEVLKKFKKHGLTLNTVYSKSEDEIHQVIKRVNYCKNKTKYLIKLITIVKGNFNEKIPGDKNILTLPSGGVKVAM